MEKLTLVREFDVLGVLYFELINPPSSHRNLTFDSTTASLMGDNGMTTRAVVSDHQNPSLRQEPEDVVHGIQPPFLHSDSADAARAQL